MASASGPTKRARPTDNNITQADNVDEKQNKSSSTSLDGQSPAKRANKSCSSDSSSRERRRNKKTKRVYPKRVPQFGNYDRFHCTVNPP